MPIFLIVFAWLAVSFAPPRPINLRFHLHAAGASSDDIERVSAAFRRGFYSNAGVTAPAETLHTGFSRSLPLDSATRARIGMIVVVDGSVRVAGNRAEVCLQLLNILAQPITEPDTVRVGRDALDSALALVGERHAQILTDGFGRRGSSTVRCNRGA